MTNLINFKNFEPLSHLQEFVVDHLEHTAGVFLQDRSLKIKVLLEKQQSKNKPQGQPDFICEIYFYHPALRKQVVVKKSSSDFYSSVRESCKAVEKSLRRLAQTKSKRRHKNFNRANALENVDKIESEIAV